MRWGGSYIRGGPSSGVHPCEESFHAWCIFVLGEVCWGPEESLLVRGFAESLGRGCCCGCLPSGPARSHLHCPPLLPAAAPVILSSRLVMSSQEQSHLPPEGEGPHSPHQFSQLPLPSLPSISWDPSGSCGGCLAAGMPGLGPLGAEMLFARLHLTLSEPTPSLDRHRFSSRLGPRD